MMTYTHIGYYNRVNDIRNIASLISQKKFIEVLDYFMDNNGSFNELKEDDIDVEETSDLQPAPWFTVVRDCVKYVIFYTFNPESIYKRIDKLDDSDDSYEYVDIYALIGDACKYTLEGVDGNSFAIMAYVKKAMVNTKLSKEEMDNYIKEATSGDYGNLVRTSQKYIDICNSKI